MFPNAMVSSFRKYQQALIVILLLGTSLTIYSSNINASGNISFWRRTIWAIYTPPLKAAVFLITKTHHLWNSYLSLVEVQKKNVLLQTKVDRLTEQNMQLGELLLENNRLRELLSLKKRTPARLVAAEIIGRDPSGWFKSVLIDKGSRHGIGPNLAVTSCQGIVGRTLEVGSDTTKVLLITDINSSVDALIQRSRSWGIVGGRGSNVCELQFVENSEDVRMGDLVVTSGLCGVFPKGLAIGRVSRIERDKAGLFQYIELTPCASLNKLEEVCVYLGNHA